MTSVWIRSKIGVLEYVNDHRVRGLHDVTIAKDLAEEQSLVIEVLRNQRAKGRIDADDRRLRATDGRTTPDNIHLAEASPDT